jgi:Zn-dependent peptidase ImmA (M78 family)
MHAERSGTTPPWVAARRDRLGPEALLRLFEVQAPPVPVERMIERLGVPLHRTRNKGWHGALVSSETRAEIWYDDSVVLGRQRFTMAHELGHLMLHPLGLDYRAIHSAGSKDRKEVEADQFAAELLMPGWMLRAYMQATTDVGKLAEHFQVSEQAMAIRLQSYFRL